MSSGSGQRIVSFFHPSLRVLFCFFSIRELWFGWEGGSTDKTLVVKAWGLKFKSPESMKSQAWKCLPVILMLPW